MRTRRNKYRIGVITAALVAMIAGGVITWNQSEHTTEKGTETEYQSSTAMENQSESGEDEMTAALSEEISETEKSDGADSVQETSGGAEGQIIVQNEASDTEEGEKTEAAQETLDGNGENTVETAGNAVNFALDFNEGMVLELPAEGTTVLIPYSMENTVYFPTLDLYQCNPGVVLGAAEGTPVRTVANSEVVLIEEDARTGTTVTMNMGNGYQAVYGQLKDVSLEIGQQLEAGTQFGTIAEPTKYYVKEGSNLYFQLKKDGKTLDPMLYLPPETE
ncbi:MAG: peptidoglycan DD-metalloendopeptidase family protein [Fusicatenibacter sp.]